MSTSVRIAFVVVIMATVLGVSAAIPLARREFRGRALIVAFLLSPMIVPTIVFAVSLHFFVSQIGMAGTLGALIVGHVIIALPFVVVVMVNALRSADASLEQVAMTLGATPWNAFSQITLVLVRPAILTAALFAFLASFDELIIALFLAGPDTTTLPKRLWDGIREEIDPTTAAVAVLIIVLSMTLIFIVDYMRSNVGGRSGTDASSRQNGILELRRRRLFR
jgi:ABC-type spermidine/putrescine transport system permease subunit II